MKFVAQLVGVVLTVFGVLGVSQRSIAQEWPARQAIRFVVVYPPGGASDVTARLLAAKLTDTLGQSVVVENRPGANGIIATDFVAKSAPDGYTLLMANLGPNALNPVVYKKLPYDALKDFAGVTLTTIVPQVVLVNPSLPIKSIPDLIAYAKANPGKMTFAVGSIGSAGHLSTELLKRAGDISYTVVPYKGTAPAFQDLIGGQIDGFIDPILGSLQFHKNGLLRVVAVTSAKRTPNLPDVPTVGETIPGYEFYSWYGLWAPARTDRAVLQRLNAETNKALSSDMKDKLVQQGLIVSPGSIEDFVKFQTQDMAQSQKIITDGNIRLD